MNRVGGLDGGTLHGPLCRVGVIGNGAGADVRQVGRSRVWLFALFETSDAGERNVVCGVT
jgi:hypothetical protein